MSTKTEETKIVESFDKRWPIIVTELGDDHPYLKLRDIRTWLTQALATYKASILAECVKCVPELEVPKGHEDQAELGRIVGINDCRTQTLQAIRNLTPL